MPILSGISSMATQGLLAELTPACLRETGLRMSIESVGGADAAKRVQAGEAFDLVVLAEDAIAKLEAGGCLVAGSSVVIADSTVAIAVPVGAAIPDVSSEDALRQAVLAAPRIGYSTGPSGAAVLKLFERWGVSPERLVQSRPGVPVASLLASGAAELGFQQLSELQGQPGIRLIGGMPPGLEIVTRFVGAIGIHSKQQVAARVALAFIGSAEGTAAIKQGQGMAQPNTKS